MATSPRLIRMGVDSVSLCLDRLTVRRAVALCSAACVAAALTCLVFVSSASALPRLECAVWYRDGETHASSTYTCNEWRVVGFEGWKQDTGFYDPYPDTTPHEGPGAGRGDTGPQRGVEQKREEAKGEADAAVAQASEQVEAEPCPQAPANGGTGNGLTGRSRQPQVQAVLPGEGSEIVLAPRAQNAIIAMNAWGATVQHWWDQGKSIASLPAAAVRLIAQQRNRAFTLANESIVATARTNPHQLGVVCRALTAGNTAVARGVIDIAGSEAVRNTISAIWENVGIVGLHDVDPSGAALANQSFVRAGENVNSFLIGAGVIRELNDANTALVMDTLNYYYRLSTGRTPPP